MHCTQCGAPGAGRFCGPCGATLVELDCHSCGSKAEPGVRFCTTCGASLRAGGEGGASARSASDRLAWVVAAVLLVAVASFGAASIFRGGSESGSMAQTPPGQLGAAPNIDLNSMSPGEAADRLYNRVAMGLSARDTMEVLNFLPMALDAHEIARPLSEVRLFRLSFLHRVALDFEAAQAVALEGLERAPNHLLLLSAAAESSREMGDEAAALGYYRRLLEVWDSEMASGLEDYGSHERLLPIIREEAERALGGA
jgi:hypothetical protein